MLFGYAALGDNWFHRCMFDAVREVHRLADTNQVYPAWPGVLPVAHRPTLQDKRRLGELFEAYDSAIRALTRARRRRVLQALAVENRVPQLLSNTQSCIRKADLPKTVQEPVAELFEFAYRLLTPLGVRAAHYEVIHAGMHAQVCPFCGIHRFCSPRSGQEAMDHYLARSIYPFAAVNLRNLVPMCHECNSDYKRATDMVECVNGLRRVAFDPYNHTRVDVTLDRSNPFGGKKKHVPKWKIDFLPNSREVDTWDQVFGVSRRYRNDLLDEEYLSWMDMFAEVVRDRVSPYSDQKLIDALQWYEDTLRRFEFQSQNFLKAAVFRMLRRHCQAGNTRLLRQLEDLVCRPP